MTEELKTLKDIEIELKFTGKEVKELGITFSDMKKMDYIMGQRDNQIKEEVIKLIKNEVFWDEEQMPREIKNTMEDCSPCQVAEDVLKWFFNITEEELK